MRLSIENVTQIDVQPSPCALAPGLEWGITKERMQSKFSSSQQNLLKKFKVSAMAMSAIPVRLERALGTVARHSTDLTGPAATFVLARIEAFPQEARAGQDTNKRYHRMIKSTNLQRPYETSLLGNSIHLGEESENF